MRIFVVDDDAYFLAKMREILDGCGECGGAETVLCGFGDSALYGACGRDVFFLDIDDGKDTDAGIKLAHELRRLHGDVHIIFVSSHTEKIPDTISGLLRPSGFITKPVSEAGKEEICAVMRMICRSDRRMISLKDGARHFDVAAEDILYVKKTDRKTSVYTEDAFYQVRQSFTAVAAKLGEGFIVVDKGTAVNIGKAVSYDPDTREIFMENGTRVCCSRDKAKFHRDILDELRWRDGS